MKLFASDFLLKITAPVVLAVMLSVSGCKKDKPATANKSLTGTWKIVTYYPNSFGNYYIFTADGKMYKCSSDADNMRFLQTGTYVQSGNLVINNLKDTYGSPVTDSRLVEFSNDTLYLHDNDPYNDIVLIKDPTGPATADDWAKQVTVLAAYNLDLEPRALTYSSGNLYFNTNGFGNYNIYKLNAANGLVTDSVVPANSYGGIEMVNNRLYATSGPKVVELSLSTGSEVTTSPANSTGANLSFLGGNGIQLYALAYNYLHGYQPGTNTFYYGISCGNGYRDLAYANDYLYIVKQNSIHKCTESLFASRRSYFVPDLDLTGLAFDGTNFWCSGQNTVTQKWQLLKIQL